MKDVIIINGVARSGKDTLIAGLMGSFWQNHKKQAFTMSSVDPYKQIAKDSLGWQGEKDEKARKMLSDLKRLAMAYNDGPMKECCRFIDDVTPYAIAIVQIRESAEIKKLQEIYGERSLSILVRRDVAELKIPNNEGDRDVLNSRTDLVFWNNSTIEVLDGFADAVARRCMGLS